MDVSRSAGGSPVMAFGGLLEWLWNLNARILEQFDMRLDDAWKPFLSEDADSCPVNRAPTSEGWRLGGSGSGVSQREKGFPCRTMHQ